MRMMEVEEIFVSEERIFYVKEGISMYEESERGERWINRIKELIKVNVRRNMKESTVTEFNISSSIFRSGVGHLITLSATVLIFA